MMGHFQHKRLGFERKVITISSSSVGSLGHLLDKISTDIFGFVIKFDTFSHSHTILRDPGIPTASLNYHIATLIQPIQNRRENKKVTPHHINFSCQPFSSRLITTTIMNNFEPHKNYIYLLKHPNLSSKFHTSK